MPVRAGEELHTGVMQQPDPVDQCVCMSCRIKNRHILHPFVPQYAIVGVVVLDFSLRYCIIIVRGETNAEIRIYP